MSRIRRRHDELDRELGTAAPYNRPRRKIRRDTPWDAQDARAVDHDTMRAIRRATLAAVPGFADE